MVSHWWLEDFLVYNKIYSIYRVYLTAVKILAGWNVVSHNRFNLKKLKVAQRAMERAMLGVSLHGWIRNEEIRRITKRNRAPRSKRYRSGDHIWESAACEGYLPDGLTTSLRPREVVGCRWHRTGHIGSQMGKPQRCSAVDSNRLIIIWWSKSVISTLVKRRDLAIFTILLLYWYFNNFNFISVNVSNQNLKDILTIKRNQNLKNWSEVQNQSQNKIMHVTSVISSSDVRHNLKCMLGKLLY